MSIPVIDPSSAARDPEMPSLALALDPAQAQRRLGRHLPRLAGENDLVHLSSIRVTRYKPGRRCVVEYDVTVERPNAPAEAVTLIGKVRARRYGSSGYRLLDALWNAGFGSDSADGISVPEPLGVIAKFRMWLQRKVPGQLATELLDCAGTRGAGGRIADCGLGTTALDAAGRRVPAGGRSANPQSAIRNPQSPVPLARRIAEAAHKLHQAGVPTERRHTMADELRILHTCLPTVAETTPRWTGRIERLLDACDRLGAATPEPPPRGIHRDFYPDQVIVSDCERLYLIDFDLYCQGDPGLDIGNFVGHLTEQSLRAFGDPDALADCERAMEDRFVELSGEATRTAVRSYAALTMARHVYLSTQFPERRPFTECLLELCEQRLDGGGRFYSRAPAAAAS